MLKKDKKKKEKESSADMGVKWEHISLSGLKLCFRAGSLNHELGLKGFLAWALSRSIGVCTAGRFPSEFLVNIIFSPDKFMQSQNISNAANSNATQMPHCWTNTISRVQIYLGETEKCEGASDTRACMGCPWSPQKWWETPETAQHVQEPWKCGWRAG